MRRALITLFAVLCLLSGCATMAGDSLVYEDSVGRVELYQRACPEKVAAMLRPAIRASFKEATYTHVPSGTSMMACWYVPEPGDKVVMVYEDTDTSVLPTAKFKKRETI